MPHLTIPTQQTGMLITVAIGITVERAKALRDLKQPIVPPVLAQGLVDTGAESTAVDHKIIEKLGLTPTGQGLVHTPSSGSVPHSVSLYDVAVYLYDHKDNYVINRPIPITGTDLSNCGCEVLIGMDVLEHCLLVLDGRAKTFALAF